MRVRASSCVLATVLAAALSACAGQGMVDDDSSVSFGPPNDGALVNPVTLAPEGDGYRMPAIWARRGLHHGTSELVAMVAHLGRALDRRDLGRPLAVADLSLESGGPSAWHRSHQTGRDVDLIFYVRSAEGRPIGPEAMRRFGADGVSLADKAGDPVVHFDDRANWMVVRELVLNPVADVQWIFIAEDLERRVLDAAAELGEPGDLVAAAAELMHQPNGALPHDDHMHVRVYCAPSDVRLGCTEIGPRRWYKKDYKYRADKRRAQAHADAHRARGTVRGLALVTVPLRGFVLK